MSAQRNHCKAATFSVFEHHFLTDQHAQLFAEAFRRQMARVTNVATHQDHVVVERLSILLSI